MLDTYQGKRADLAAELGMSRTKLWSWASSKGKTEPKFSELLAIGEKFTLNMNWLFYSEGEMFRAIGVPAKVVPLSIVPRRTENVGECPTPYRVGPVEVEISEEEYNSLLAQYNLHEAAYAMLRQAGANPEILRAITHAIVSMPIDASTAETYTAMKIAVEGIVASLLAAGAGPDAIVRTVLAVLARPF